MEGMVSIVMPVYNGEQFIERAIVSVLKQSYKSWELIIIDDCSLDSTVSIVEKYADNEKVIFFRNHRNRGPASARNRGINNSRGKYIAFLDSDDFWIETKLELQIKKMCLNNIDIVLCGVWRLEESSRRMTSYIPKATSLRDIYRSNFIILSSALLARDGLGSVDLAFPEIVDNAVEDWAFWIHIYNSKRNINLDVIPEELVYYSVNDQNISGGKALMLKKVWRMKRVLMKNSLSERILGIIIYIYESVKKHFFVFRFTEKKVFRDEAQKLRG